MQTSLYSVTVPQFINTLNKVSEMLGKAEAFVAEKNIEETELTEARLAPDMFPFIKQVQVACDNAKALAARLNGTDPVPMADDETTLEDLRARIEKTVLLLKEIKPQEVDGHEEAEVRVKYFPGMHFTGYHYALEYVVPNFYFHCVTAYAILRMKGVPLGKADFLALTLQKDA